VNHVTAYPSPAALLTISAADWGAAQIDGAAASHAAIGAAVHRAWLYVNR